ncbi:murein hydrolase activator EnvC family protein [Egicoccus halophilus]|uniref:M23ase beta-sheet core domain-containing protein n=1 Tax=Egicoccus halophilus TaxID=1670830 RepID=A0A8J3AB21_9ACTN|nr:M23 family metallopeptidase [Egicoccus halophilus]GGI09723.1 hypothetical protein GCM10011354_35490 [Egicoccus halophilus]
MSLRRHPSRRRLRAVAAVAAVLVVVPTTAAAQPRDDGRSGDSRTSDEVARELGEADEEAGDLSSELGRVHEDLLAAEEELAQLALQLDDARGRLRAAEGQVALAEVAREEAERAQRTAEAEHRRRERALERTRQRLLDEEQLLTQQLVETFKYGTAGATRGAMVIEVLRRAEDPNSFAVGLKQLKVVVDTQESTVQQVFALRERRTTQERDAARARSRATQAATEAADTLAWVEDLQAQEAALTAEIEQAELRQREVLAGLQADAEQTTDLLARVDVRRAELQVELVERRLAEDAERREREMAAAVLGRSLGGPSVAGGFCPVEGAVANRDFSNDWGYPRSGGRTHEGTDMFADRGVAVVAIAEGTVVRVNPADSPTSLGGVTVTYRTADGSEWYNAHLDTIAEDLTVGTTVAAGEQIGTVGNTGNARTTPPHLHLGRRIDGAWVNPYPTIAGLCR